MNDSLRQVSCRFNLDELKISHPLVDKNVLSDPPPPPTDSDRRSEVVRHASSAQPYFASYLGLEPTDLLVELCILANLVGIEPLIRLAPP